MRHPLVLDTHELGRRAGATELVSRSVPAPADLGIEVMRVPEGSPMQLELRLESVVEGVLVSGQVGVRAEGECARCLDPLERTLAVDLQELYAYPGHEAEAPDEDVRPVVDDLVDLEPAIRDAVVLALPLAPLCRPDCPGLCSVCGARLADDPDHTHDVGDPRWAALAALHEDDDTNQTTGGRTIGDRTSTTEIEES